jgi:hypothetical protein
VDALVDSVDDEGNGAHARRLQNAAIAFGTLFDLETKLKNEILQLLSFTYIYELSLS